MKGKNGHEKSSSHRRAKVDHLPQSEWYFEQVPDHLVHHCWLWEFCRELYWQNEELREAVEAYWRKTNELDDWHRHVEYETDWPNVSGGVVFTKENIRWREPFLDDQKGTGPKWRVRTRLELIAIGESLAHLPDWEDFALSKKLERGEIKGFLSTDHCIERLMDYDETFGFGGDLASSVALASKDIFTTDPLTQVHSSEAGNILIETDAFIDATDLLPPLPNLVNFTIDLNKSNDELSEEFRRFIEEERPTPHERRGSGGKTKTPEINELRALGGLRLLCHYKTQPNVIDALIARKRVGETVYIPYAAPSNWSDAKATAKAALADLVRSVQNKN